MLGRQQLDRPQQVGQALLPGDPPDEDDQRPVGVDAERRAPSSAASGEVSRTQPEVSIPLCTTWTRSGSMSGYDRRMSARIPPLTAITAWAPRNAVRSQNDDTA